MTDRDAPHKNPERVPMALQAMDDRTAHYEPVNVLGREGTMPARKIEKTGIYRDADGKYFFMAEGDTTGRDVEFSHERGSRPSTRAKQAAPENKARKSAPASTKAKTAASSKDKD